MLRGDNEMITDDKRLAKLFNEHYINIAERFCGLKPEKKICHNEGFDKRIVLHNIKKYENHSSIIKIKSSMSVKTHLNSNNTLTSARLVTSNEVNLTIHYRLIFANVTIYLLSALALKSKNVQGIFGETFILTLLSSAVFRLQIRVSDFICFALEIKGFYQSS